MKITHLLFVFLLSAPGLFAQEPKGVASIPQAASRIPHATRAVVVGISDYQDPGIADLQFADRDAEAFAAWLRSPAGGSVPADELKLLINKKAAPRPHSTGWSARWTVTIRFPGRSWKSRCLPKSAKPNALEPSWPNTFRRTGKGAERPNIDR